mmetsp:Transcript_43989/g.127008  ORF Transcript_43989/g.127008 Transcript_43989/m.127008 type:complete len:224 (+) Transcript_43989:1590-2261(+)
MRAAPLEARTPSDAGAWRTPGRIVPAPRRCGCRSPRPSTRRSTPPSRRATRPPAYRPPPSWSPPRWTPRPPGARWPASSRPPGGGPRSSARTTSPTPRSPQESPPSLPPRRRSPTPAKPPRSGPMGRRAPSFARRLPQPPEAKPACASVSATHCCRHRHLGWVVPGGGRRQVRRHTTPRRGRAAATALWPKLPTPRCPAKRPAPRRSAQWLGRAPQRRATKAW